MIVLRYPRLASLILLRNVSLAKISHDLEIGYLSLSKQLSGVEPLQLELALDLRNYLRTAIPVDVLFAPGVPFCYDDLCKINNQ